MLKKIKVICMIFFLLVTAGLLSACCGPRQLKVNIVFQDVDPNMGVKNYVEKIGVAEGVKIEFVIPEGWTHEGMTATVNGEACDFEVEYADENLEEKYRYATEKKIILEFPKIIINCDIVFQMKDVRLKQFEIEVSKDILDTTQYTTEIDNKHSITTTQLSVVSITPESTDRLLHLGYDTNIIEERTFENNTIKVYYGEYIILCYDKSNTNHEIDTMYSEIGYFTNEKNISSVGAVRFAEYNVACRGNTYYTYAKRNAIGSSRLYYLGRIQDDIKLDDSIPNYEEEKGFVLDNNENKFSLLTNMQDYNSDMLTISVYKPTNKVYSVSDPSLDIIDGVVVEKIEKYAQDGSLKNSSLLYDYLNRYDVYNMYIGQSISTDPLLSNKEKESLSDTLYISVKTEEELTGALNYHLLYYEKQNPYKDSYVTLTDLVSSDKGQEFIKIDKETIQNFLMDRSMVDGNNTIYYETGNAIFYVEIDKNFIDENRMRHNFNYYTINMPVKYDGSTSIINYDYIVKFYILNEDGSKDYGFIDMQNYGNVAEDYVYFRADKLYKQDENGLFIVDGYQNYVYEENLYVDVIGPKYNHFYSPVIEKIYISLSGHTMNASGLPVKDPVEFNGLKGILIEGLSDYQGCTWQKNITVAPDLTDASTLNKVIDFEYMQFENPQTDMIYVSNDVELSSSDNFIAIDNISKYNNYDISLGWTVDIYYFVVSDSDIDFDVYLAERNENGEYVASKDETRIISTSKPLLDIVGNEVEIYVNGRPYKVYVKYQYMDVYNVKLYQQATDSYDYLLGNYNYAF